MGSGSKGIGSTNFVANISWEPNVYHEIALTYSSSATTLYIDGSSVTNGSALQYFPAATVRASSGLNVGSDLSRAHLAQGEFEWLETFNYVLSSGTISTNYSSRASTLDSDLDGLTDAAESLAGTDPGLSDTDGDGIPDGFEVAHSLNPLVAGGTTDTDGDGVDDYTEFILGRNVTVPGVLNDTNSLINLRIFTPLR